MNIKMIDVDNLIKERVNILNIDDNKFNEDKCELEKKYNELIVKNIMNIIRDNKFNKYMFLNGESKSKEKIISYIANKLGINLININCLEFNDEFPFSTGITLKYKYPSNIGHSTNHSEILSYTFTIYYFLFIYTVTALATSSFLSLSACSSQ